MALPDASPKTRSIPWFGFALVASCLAAVAPLWASRYLPAVDAPQHLFLMRVMDEISNPSTLYSSLYEVKPGLTYLTFYAGARLLGRLFGLELGLKLYLSLVLGTLPLCLWALLSALKRNRWLAVLAAPLALTDNFYWGLFSFQSTLGAMLLAVAALARVLESSEPRRAWWGTLAASLLFVQLTHAANMPFILAALGIVAALTPSERRRRLEAIVALLPGTLLFLVWGLIGVRPTGVASAGQDGPWQAHGSPFSPDNLSFVPPAEALSRLPELLANGFWSWRDRPVVWGLSACAGLSAILWLAAFRQREPFVGRANLRPAALALLALGFYLALPFDIKGYMYALSPRFAQVAALFAVPALPKLPQRSAAAAGAFALLVALANSANLAVLFREFGAEAAEVEPVLTQVPRGARVMHLVFQQGSRIAAHPVFLHYAAYAAFRAHGVPSFSFALHPSLPVHYLPGKAPPAPPSEWRPWEISDPGQAAYYDVFLARAAPEPELLFPGSGPRISLLAQSGPWRLYGRTIP